MMTSTLFLAFGIGLLSACSLPLGTITSAFWRPSDRVVAFLMSFGGGALLAALTIDLAGPALARGHFYWLAAGCIAGGVLFVVLDQVVNRHGGFLRKVSTTISHLRQKRARRVRRVLSRLRRLGVFSTLSRDEARGLAASMTSRFYRKGASIFQDGDASDCLFFVEDGEVRLLDPDNDDRLLLQARKNDAFGYLALLTGCPHAAIAEAEADSNLLLLPREAFQSVLTASGELQHSVAEFLASEKTREYLSERQGLEPDRVSAWVGEAVAAVHAGLPTPAAVECDEAIEPDFRTALEEIERIPIFHGLPDEDIEFLAARCFTKTHKEGHTFFHPGEPAGRLYILEVGRVAIVDAKRSHRAPERIEGCDEFGALSFLTGAKHSVSAVAVTDVTVRVLLRRDFDELLGRSPAFAHAVEEFIRQETLADYLHKKHRFDTDKTTRWVNRALGRVGGGNILPSAADMTREIQQHQGAPIAIWLGILLDGIPESLVIGASMIDSSTVSFSLIAGLFLSNYPEALSSSVGMRQQGMRFGRILWMWTSLMILTGIGAALGTIFFAGAPPHLYSLVQGVAAGAMLTMIAQTMLPEAFFKGGSITGFATLLGFLAAIFFKTLEGPGVGH